MKTCTKCGVEKDLSDFGIIRGRYRSRCNPCRREDYKEYYARNREAINAKHREIQPQKRTHGDKKKGKS